MPKTFSEVYLPQWQTAHPTYEIRLWTEESLSTEEPFENDAIIRDLSLNPGLRADALRLEVLQRYGGIYVDIDMACLRPIDSLLAHPLDFVIGISYTRAFEVNNAFLASSPDHELLKHLVKQLGKNYQSFVDKRDKQKTLFEALASFDPSAKE